MLYIIRNYMITCNKLHKIIIYNKVLKFSMPLCIYKYMISNVYLSYTYFNQINKKEKSTLRGRRNLIFGMRSEHICK